MEVSRAGACYAREWQQRAGSPPPPLTPQRRERKRPATSASGPTKTRPSCGGEPGRERRKQGTAIVLDWAWDDRPHTHSES